MGLTDPPDHHCRDDRGEQPEATHAANISAPESGVAQPARSLKATDYVSGALLSPSANRCIGKTPGSVATIGRVTLAIVLPACSGIETAKT